MTRGKTGRCSHRKLAGTVFSLLLIGGALPPASAQTVTASPEHFDLDSLVFLSDTIVKGRIDAREGEGEDTVCRVSVAKSWRGDLKPGGIAWFRNLDLCSIGNHDSSESKRKLGAGDEVVLFAISAKPLKYLNRADGAPVYLVVDVGVFLIKDEKACGFRSESVPGGFVAKLPAECPALVKFEAVCAAAVPRVDELAKRLRQPAGADAAPWLVKLLEARSSAPLDELWVRDRLVEAACSRLVEMGDLSALDQALPLVRQSENSIILYRGFASAKGRAFILQQLLANRDPARRKLYAAALPFSALHYGSAADSLGEGHFERQAKTALQLIKDGDETTACELLRQLRHAADQYDSFSTYTRLKPDIVAALELLRQAPEARHSLRLSFHVDSLMLAADPALGYGSHLSPLATLVTESRILPANNGATREMECGYAFSSGGPALARHFEIQLMLEDLDTALVRPLGDRLEIDGRSSGLTALRLPLPETLPAGRYRLFFRHYENANFLGQGYGLEIRTEGED